MPYMKTRDILDRASEFHRLLSVFYKSLSSRTEKERVKMLLEYMGRHEEYLEKGMRDYTSETSKKISDTWFKFVPNSATARCFEDIEIDPSMSVDDAVRLALHLDDCLMNLYREMAKNSQSEEVREVFKNLLLMETEEEMMLLRDALDL